VPPPVDFNAVPLVRPLVATLRLVCGLTLSEHLRCGELFHSLLPLPFPPTHKAALYP
jgi:hypothetical protein